VTSAEQTYSGEFRDRKKWIAVLLTFICPGLGSIYVGQLLRGLMLNLVFLMALELFIIAWSLLKFFPILPFLVFLVGWLVFSTLLALENVRRIEQTEYYVLKGFNHWTIYLVAYLLSFVAPIALTIGFTTDNLWQLNTVETGAMYPSIQPGDTVLTDLNAFNAEPPGRGDVVAVDTPGSGRTNFLRIVATPGDIVRMEGNTLYVNDQAVGQSPLQIGEVTQSNLDQESGLLALVEHNQDSRYVIAVSPRVFSALTLPPTRLEPHQYFLLTDNRSQIPIDGGQKVIRDSRNFGTVDGREIEGTPRYIFWSRGPDGAVRWERIGLRVR
jgi:signal peptidase I